MRRSQALCRTLQYTGEDVVAQKDVDSPHGVRWRAPEEKCKSPDGAGYNGTPPVRARSARTFRESPPSSRHEVVERSRGRRSSYGVSASPSSATKNLRRGGDASTATVPSPPRVGSASAARLLLAPRAAVAVASHCVERRGAGASAEAVPSASAMDSFGDGRGRCTERCRDKEAALEQEMRGLRDRLTRTERERNWAMDALRATEAELQSTFEAKAESPRRLQKPSSPKARDAMGLPPGAPQLSLQEAEMHLRHYRVLVDLTSCRCAKLEKALELEAKERASREEMTRRTLEVLEDQNAQIAIALAEQQRAFKSRRADMLAEREQMVRDHQLEVEALRARADADIAALKEVFREPGSWLQKDCGRQAQHLELSVPQANHGWQTADEDVGRARQHHHRDSYQGDSLAPILESPTDGPSECADQSVTEEEALSRKATAMLGFLASCEEEEVVLVATPRGDRSPPVCSRRPEDSADVGTASRAAACDGTSRSEVVSFAADGTSDREHKPLVLSDRDEPGEQRWRAHSPVPGFLTVGLPRSQGSGLSTTAWQQVDHDSSQIARLPLPLPTESRPPALGRGSQPRGPAFSGDAFGCGRSLPPSPQFGHFKSEAEVGGGGSYAIKQQFSGDIPKEMLASLQNADDPQQAARAWTRIGQVQQRKKLFHEARAAYNAAMQLDGSLHGCIANLAQLEAHAGNLGVACDLIERALNLEPKNPSYISFARWLKDSLNPSSRSPTTAKGSLDEFAEPRKC
eukprot:TRINITY_DN29119_c0_g1_i1.p1 TRINITY_DN29119_c0_g1~~TRINITY_DN29119_c0_g1_i1.p1  ORF type:complete len:748 (+),score=141.29 TRINITY_DN29119_c0_g1_i1:195-2438(+)